jgi:MFS transporter, DHA2 family, multidrug resistance protein
MARRQRGTGLLVDPSLNSDAGAMAEAIPLARSDRLLATIALMVATGMQAADATIANVALPQLERDLGGGLVLGAWVMTSYLCANALAAPLTGWLRRRFGARYLFAVGTGVFVAASLLCSLSPTPTAIILSRIAQGAGGGIIHPLAQAILLDLYPKRQHGRMLGIWGAVIMVGPIFGPALGGIITDLASWRWVFAVNLPLGVLAIWGMRRVLPKTERGADMAIDVLGIALLAIAVGALQLWLARGVGQDWLHSPELLAETAVAAVAFAAIAARIGQGRFTVFRPSLFRDVNFAAAAFYNFMTSALLFVVIVFIPALGEGPLGFGATVVGFTLVPRGILMMLTMLLVGQISGKIDLRIVLATGNGLMAGGLVMLSAVTAQAAVPWIVIGSTLQAVGGGMLFTSLSTLGFATLAPDMRTDAAGVYSLLRQLGCASGVALMTAVLHMQVDANLLDLFSKAGGPGATPAAELIDRASLQAYSACFRAMAVAALIVVPGIWFFRPRARSGEAIKDLA